MQSELTAQMLADMGPEDRYLYEERAAIIEYCGNVPRDVAEHEAWLQLYPNGCPILEA